MRIKAQVVNKAPIYEMANGASESIGSLKANTLITLVQSKKDGVDTYYLMDEYRGYIKKKAVKIIRDEEFYYASSLLQKKQNRATNNRFNLMKKSIAADTNTPSTRPSSSVKAPSSSTANTGAGNKPDNGDGLVKQYNNTNVKAAQSQSTDKPAGKTSLVGAIATGVLGSVMGRNNNPLVATGLTMATSVISTGNFNAVNNMNLGGLAGGLFGSKVGSMFNGATINNLLDGSFFTSGSFMQNAMSIINNILGTLFQKLDYIVGFNLSGTLANYLGGFSSYAKGLTYINGASANNRLPDILTRGGDADSRIREYFRYKGTNVKIVGKAPTNLAGGAIYGPIDYSTSRPSLSGEKSEYVEVHRNLFNNLYADFANDLKAVRSSVNLNMVRNDWFYNFNRFRLIHPDSVLANSKGYVFFTRPDLNIVSSSTATSEIGMLMYNMASFHAGIVAGLQLSPQMSNASFDNGHKFIPLLCNRCTGIDINDETLETKEIGDTYTGWKLNYGTTTIKSKTANTVTTSFFDDEQLSIYLTFKLWEEYINGVSRGIILPKDTYIKTKQLDYAISIYYFLCAEDGESIIFWTKYTGCIPTNIPSSNFTDSIESPIKQPKYSITWQYAFKKDYDPYSLAEFNGLSDSGSNGQGVKIYDEETFRSVRTLSGAPFVDTNTGGRLFKLRFRAAKNSFESEYK